MHFRRLVGCDAYFRLVLPKDEMEGNVKSLFIYMVQHNHFIGLESRKKIFAMSYIISCDNFLMTKGIRRMYSFVGKKFSIKSNLTST